MENKKIAILELGKFHQEVLYSQVMLLKKANYQIHLICSEQIAQERDEFFIEKIAGQLVVKTTSGFWSSLRQSFKLRRYLKKNQIERLILNTADQKSVKYLPWLLKRIMQVEILGVFRNIASKGFWYSFFQKAIQKKIVLSAYLYEQLQQKLTSTFLYPIYFKDLTKNTIKKDPSEFWVVIPGELNMELRAYDFLFQSLGEQFLHQDVKLIFLGKPSSGEELNKIKELAKQKKVNKNCIFFDRYLPIEKYYHYVQHADILLPLLQPDRPEYQKFWHKSTMGAYHLALTFKKNLLLHESFAKHDEYAKATFCYQNNNLIATLNIISKHRLVLQQKAEQTQSSKDLLLENQFERYIQLIEKKI